MIRRKLDWGCTEFESGANLKLGNWCWGFKWVI
jgi:hypothetical protein